MRTNLFWSSPVTKQLALNFIKNLSEIHFDIKSAVTISILYILKRVLIIRFLTLFIYYFIGFIFHVCCINIFSNKKL